ncbi:flavodoxin-like protein [Ramicandelaber brevisporus]|nr:flavodoxin-like protein [Ramicandelaber brevisporus]
MSTKLPVKISIVFYSMYGHNHRMALKILEGVKTIPGIEAKLYRVPETLPVEVLTKMHAAPELTDIPLATPDTLAQSDGILFGTPTRFGTACAQMRAFLDATGGLWAKGSLVGKHAGIFTSSNTQHGGQETTALTFLTYFAHQGLNFVPLGYRSQGMSTIDEVIGGTPYGASAVNGNNLPLDVRPTKTELEIAFTHGKSFAEVVRRSVVGAHAIASEES